MEHMKLIIILCISADTTSGNVPIVTVEKENVAVVNSISRLTLATTVANDIYTLSNSVIFTASAGDEIQINVNKADANNMTVEALSGYQIKFIQ